MNTTAFFLAALCSGALLLGGCNGEKPTDTTAATPETAAPAAAPTTPPAAAGDMAGMDHTAPAGTSPQLAAMNAMMAKMTALKPMGNTDHDFAHMMLEHHRGAVAMADIQLRDGQDATMRQLAEKIKADQQKEIGELQAIAERLDAAPTNYKPQNPADPFTAQMKASMAGMMQMPASVANPDMNFNMLMTMHHQSAVDMARAELAHGKDIKLKEMAQQIISAQQKEIQQFQDWHAKNADKMKTAATYVCPMGDGGQGTVPGKCPKCGMDLEKQA